MRETPPNSGYPWARRFEQLSWGSRNGPAEPLPDDRRSGLYVIARAQWRYSWFFPISGNPASCWLPSNREQAISLPPAGEWQWSTQRLRRDVCLLVRVQASSGPMSNCCNSNGVAPSMATRGTLVRSAWICRTVPAEWPAHQPTQQCASADIGYSGESSAQRVRGG